MPKPKKGESKNDYMSRCVPEVMKEGKTNEQAVGQCIGMWNSSMSKNFQSITINLKGDSVRDETLEGEEYWVSPMVIMVEGVHNGSQGKLFYSAEELEKWTPAWNYKPIVAPDHPTEGSACVKEFLDDHKIGVILNAEWDGKQRAEGWFHKKRTTSIEPRVANALKQGRNMELSTGLFVDPAGEPSEFKGQKYDSMAVNHRPDHLAVMPDKVGACSCKKGCGTLQLNEASFTKITHGLEMALTELYASELKKMPSLYPPYTREVFEDYCIFYFGGNTYKVSYSVSSDEEVSLKGDPVQVEMKVNYVPVKNTEDSQEGEIPMAKKDLIDKIIKNCERTGYEESDRKMLEGLDDKKLEKISKNSDTTTAVLEANGVKITSQEELDAAVAKGLEEAIAKDPTGIQNKASAILKDKEEKEKPSVKNTDPPKELTVEEFMQRMPSQFRAIHNNAMKAYENEVKQHIAVITANKGNAYKPEDLAKMDIDLLRNMSRLAQPQADPNQQIAMPNYMGLGIVPAAVTNVAPVEEELPLPVYNAEGFQKAAAGK